MVFEYNYKVDGDVLYGADLRENDAMWANAMLHLIMDGASNSSQPKIKIYPFTALTDIDSSNSTALCHHIGAGSSLGGYIYFCKAYDTHSGTAISTARWTVGSGVTSGTPTFTLDESGGVMRMVVAGASGHNGNVYANSKGSSSELNFDSFSGDSEAIFNLKHIGTTAAASANVSIWDGTNFTILGSYHGGTTSYDRYRLIFDKSADTFNWYKNDTLIGSNSSLAAFTAGSWWLRFYVTVGGAATETSTLWVYNEGYIDGSAGSATLITSAQSTGRNGVPIGSVNVGLCSAVFNVGSFTDIDVSAEFSANSGNNWQTGDARAWIENTNPGSEVQWKFAVAYPTTITYGNKNIPTITKFGGIWG